MNRLVYTVVFAGESVVSPMHATPIRVETFSTEKGARDRVAEYIKQKGLDVWHVEYSGQEWRNDDDGLLMLHYTKLEDQSC